MALKQRYKRKQSGGLLVRLMIALLLLITIGGFFGRKYYRWVFASNIIISETADPFLYVPTHSSFNDVLASLKKGNYLKDEKGFIWVANIKHYPANIKPGRYRLKHGLNNNELVNILRSGRQTAVKVTFNNIRTREQLAGIISQRIEADSMALLSALNNDQLFKTFHLDQETALTLFIPNTYEFWWNTSAESFIKRMHTEHTRFWNAERLKQAETCNLSPVEVSILAAIVDEETIKADEKPQVAGLYLNRLDKGIRLQADPTIKYAIGDFTVKRILNKDLETDSPYNTYMYAGLPPGPIRIPSVSGIEAVLKHTEHKYLYMCAKDDFSGYHNFAKTLSQHNRNAAKYRKALRERKIFR
ncbi:MAG: endolytic transglycosylase MltG [Marinilabiliaceae bacterium]|nr:endolytic transglycosylase MltG [Marinilabiliaceae bacterium]